MEICPPQKASRSLGFHTQADMETCPPQKASRSLGFYTQAFLASLGKLMGSIKRFFIPDSIVFVTLVTKDRKPLFSDNNSNKIFRETLEKVQNHHPFDLIAYVILPDHIHLLIKPHKKEGNFASIVHSIKRNFTINYKGALETTEEFHAWQPGYWDHIIRDESDFQRHVDYIHWNPVKHGNVSSPEEWANSSYNEWISEETGGYGNPPSVYNL
jgi:putative transposase